MKKKIQELEDKKEFLKVLKSFYVEARIISNAFVVSFFKTMYNKTVIRFGFCDTQNNQSLDN